MRFNISLTSYTVHTDYISVKAVVNNPIEDAVILLKELKGKTKKMRFDNASVASSIKSINVTKRISVTIHTEKERYTAVRLYELSEQDKPFNLYVNSNMEDKLQNLLKQVSAKTGRSQEDILEQASTFCGKNGVTIAGRKSIYDLTVNWQKTVESKLSGILKEQVQS